MRQIVEAVIVEDKLLVSFDTECAALLPADVLYELANQRQAFVDAPSADDPVEDDE